MRVRLDVGGSTKTASLVTGGATRGTARALVFRYTVRPADRDADGVFPKPNNSGDIVQLVGAATLTDAHEQDASRQHAALSADANHKVNGSLETDPAPTVESAALVGTTLTVTFSEPLAALDTTPTARPLNRAFLVVGIFANNYVNPSTVSLSGATLTLDLVNVPPGDRSNVRLGYYPDWTSTPLRDRAGNKVAHFADEPVTYDAGGRPVLETAAVVARGGAGASTLRLTFDEALDAASLPAGSAFRLEVTDPKTEWIDVVRGTGTASITGAVVTVTLAAEVDQDASARAYYEKPPTSPLRDADRNEVADLEQIRVTVVDAQPPALVSGSVAGATAILSFDEALDTGSAPAAGDFTVTASAGGTDTDKTVSTVAVAGNAVRLTLDSAT